MPVIGVPLTTISIGGEMGSAGMLIFPSAF
jgi:hypothetical protein